MFSPALLAIGLGLFSAITVALANFSTKVGGDVLTARMVLSIGMGLCVLPFLPFVPAPPLALWPSLIFAIGVHWIYQTGLVRALHRGDLSRVFPLMRGSAPILVALLAMPILGETLEPLGWAGLVLASLAVISFAWPEKGFRSAAQIKTDRSALFWAGITALGIGAYSVVDASVIRQMPSPYTFIVYLFALDWIGITIVTVFVRRGVLWQHVRPQLKPALLGSLAGTLSYAAALYAFTLTDAAIVTALRETSVVWAALMGAIWLKEGFGGRRIIAACVLVLGLGLMQFAG